MEFQAWFSRRAKALNISPDPDAPQQFYDARGAWKEGLRSTKEHLPDTYKLPGHPTFSVESKYYKPGMKAGKWEGGKFVPYEEWTQNELAVSHAALREMEPPPFDLDSAFGEWNKTQPLHKVGENEDSLTNILHPFTRPFMAQGYSTISSLNRGVANLFTHLDSIADFIEIATEGKLKKGDAFERIAEWYDKDADRWKKRAEEVGVNVLDEIVGEIVGSPPGIAQFSLDLSSGLTFPYMAGAAQAFKRGEDPFVGGIVNAAKTGILGALFKMLPGYNRYINSAIMGTIFGAQAASEAPEGQKIRAGIKGGAVGAGLGLVTPGGALGVRDIAEGLKPMVEKAGEAARTGRDVLASERGAIGPKPPFSIDSLIGQLKALGIKGVTPESEAALRSLPPEFINKVTGVRQFTEAENKHYAKTQAFFEESSGQIAVRKGTSVSDIVHEIAHNVRKNVSLEDRQAILSVMPGAKKGEPEEVFADAVAEYALDKKAFAKRDPEIRRVVEKYVSGESPIPIEELEMRPMKFIQTIEDAARTDPRVKEGLREIQKEEPQMYYVQPMDPAMVAANKRLETEGVEPLLDFVLSDKPVNQEKAAAFSALMDKAEKEGDWQRYIMLGENWGMQAQDPARFIQFMSRISRGTPVGFIKMLEREMKKAGEHYSWADTLLKRRPDTFTFTSDEKAFIAKEMGEIRKLPDDVEKVNRMSELIGFAARKVPPSVSEWIDAYRYQNALSGIPTFLFRNPFSNTLQTFLTRPFDIATGAGIDWVKSVTRGKDREFYISDVPTYYKMAANAFPNAWDAFLLSMKMEDPGKGRPDTGVEYKNRFEQERMKQLPLALTAVKRFMEGTDKFYTALISAGESARLMKEGVPEAEAVARGQKVAEVYLFRDKIEPGDPQLSLPAKALEGLGWILDQSRRVPGPGKYLSKLYVMFLRTPIKFGVQSIEHSPLAWARTNFDTEPMAKAMAGSLVAAAGYWYAMRNETNGPAPTDEKSKMIFYGSGRVPWSHNVGGYFVPVWYAGPYALSLAIPIALKHAEVADKRAMLKDGPEKALIVTTSLAKFLASQTSAQSFGNMAAMMTGDMDYTFWSQTAFSLGQFIPLQGMVRYVSTITDNVYRKPQGIVQQWEKDLPFLSKDLPSRKGLFNEIQKRETINYFLPYNVGIRKPRYEKIYSILMSDAREQYFDYKMQELGNKLNAQEISFEEYVESSHKIFDESLKEARRMVDEINKKGDSLTVEDATSRYQKMLDEIKKESRKPVRK
jgi:hypothetical protein